MWFTWRPGSLGPARDAVSGFVMEAAHHRPEAHWPWLATHDPAPSFPPPTLQPPPPPPRDLLERGGGGGEGVRGGAPPPPSERTHSTRNRKLLGSEPLSAWKCYLVSSNQGQFVNKVNAGFPHLPNTQQIQQSGTFTIFCHIIVICKVNQNPTSLN